MEKQQVECIYEENGWSFDNFYTSTVENKIISTDSQFEFIGEHVNGKANQDVEAIYFYNCEMSKIPQKLTKIFPKLKHLCIKNSKLKSIERIDLKQFTDLREFWCNENEIEYLPGDLFVDHINLEGVGFSNNKIEIIEPNLLDGLEKLKCVIFSKNPSIDKYWNSNDKTGNTTLDTIKNEIQTKFSTSSWKILYEGKQKLEQEFNAHKNGICSDLKKITQNEKLKDFTVTVNDEEFQVHKLVLAARSPVLKEMIENNIDAESLNLIDISKEIFREILNFIYTDELPQSDDINFIHLYAAAELLKIENLKKFAAEKLKEKINEDNVLEILILANKYENEELRQEALQKAKQYYSEEIIADLTSNSEKLKKYLAIRKKKEEFLKQMDLELESVLKEKLNLKEN